MSPLKVLISGAGIAGPATAFWLNKAGMKTTIIERSPALRKAGQQIDIRGAAIKIINRMGIEEDIRRKAVLEQGIAFVDTTGKRKAEFPVSANGGSFTCEIEIQKGELTQILYDASKDDTEYIFGDHVTAVDEREDGVKVTLASGSVREFDFIVAADGMGSKIRRLTFPDPEPVKSLGMYTAFFSIPYLEEDGGWAKWYNAPGRRSIMLRPDEPTGLSRAYLLITSTVPVGHEKKAIDEQKKIMQDLFADAGWESERILEGIQKSDDFYMQEIAQVKMDHLSSPKGRIVLAGDAGYCPSPFSGLGTTLAIIGGYILAGEISNNPGNLKEAMMSYEKKMKAFVDKAQKLFPGFPWITTPQTQLEITCMNLILAFLSWSGLMTVVRWFSKNSTEEEKSLPKYVL